MLLLPLLASDAQSLENILFHASKLCGNITLLCCATRLHFRLWLQQVGFAKTFGELGEPERRPTFRACNSESRLKVTTQNKNTNPNHSRSSLEACNPIRHNHRLIAASKQATKTATATSEFVTSQQVHFGPNLIPQTGECGRCGCFGCCGCLGRRRGR